MPRKKSTALVVGKHRVEKNMILPDNDQWTNRFKIRSESSNRLYIVAQHKSKRYWGCSCPAYITSSERKPCKHMMAIGLYGRYIPQEFKLKEGKRN